MFGRKCISALMEYQAMTNERDFVIEHIRERLRRLASQQDMLTGIASLGGIREMRADNKQLRSIIGDLLWAIGHDDEQILNETTARAKAVLENKPSVVEAPEMCWHTENKPRTDHDEELWEEAFAEGWDRGRSTMRIENERLELLAVNRLIEIDRLTALVQSNDDITWELTGENMRLKRWIYATARSLEKSSLSLEEYNAITAEVCHALEPKP